MLLVLIIAVPSRKDLQILDGLNEHVLQPRALIFFICVESFSLFSRVNIRRVLTSACCLPRCENEMPFGHRDKTLY